MCHSVNYHWLWLSFADVLVDPLCLELFNTRSRRGERHLDWLCGASSQVLWLMPQLFRETFRVSLQRLR